MSKLASIKEYENQLVDMNKPNNLVFNVNGEDILILETNGDIRVKGNLIKNDIEVYDALVELLLRGGHSYKLKQAQERIEELEIANKVLVEVRDNYEVKYKELEAEIEKLKERCERQIWNLGGVSTLLLGYSIDEFNKEYALPALTDTNEFVKKYQQLQAENKAIREQLEAEIKELKDNQLCQCGDYHDKESLCSVCVMVKVSEAESKIQPAVDKAREQLIQELKQLVEKDNDGVDDGYIKRKSLLDFIQELEK